MKLKHFLALTFALALFSSSVSSAPVYYTVEGVITGIYGNGPSVDALNLSYQDSVSYGFMIDKERKGYSVSGNGSITYAEDSMEENDSSINFYAELTSISYTVTETYYNWGRENYIASNIDCYCYGSLVGRVTVGPEMLYLDTSSFIENWQIGDSFGAAHWWHDSVTGDFISMYSNLTLTEITEVPLPGALTLYLSSIVVALFPISRKRASRER